MAATNGQISLGRLKPGIQFCITNPPNSLTLLSIRVSRFPTHNVPIYPHQPISLNTSNDPGRVGSSSQRVYRTASSHKIHPWNLEPVSAGMVGIRVFSSVGSRRRTGKTTSSRAKDISVTRGGINDAVGNFVSPGNLVVG